MRVRSAASAYEGRARCSLIPRTRSLISRPGLLAALLTSLLTAPAFAAEEAEASGEAQPSQAEIEAWLESRALPDTRGDQADTGDDEVPPPPPRATGVVVESGLGAVGYLGTLKNVTPTSPWLHLQLGYEVFDWAMVFAETDLAFGSTSYANPPPQPRAFAIYGFGAGLRFTVRPTDRVGLYLQGSVGGAMVSDDVLQVYGYRDAHEMNPYYGGLLGVEWYQVSSHYALALAGGVRNYDMGFARQRSSGTELSWLGLASLRYAF